MDHCHSLTIDACLSALIKTLSMTKELPQYYYYAVPRREATTCLSSQFCDAGDGRYETQGMTGSVLVSTYMWKSYSHR